MYTPRSHVLRWLLGYQPLGTSPDVGRVFLLCDDCRRVVPLWRLVGPKQIATGCRCGASLARPRHIHELRAAWWVLVRGWLIRRVLLRRREWDPRMPLRRLV